MEMIGKNNLETSEFIEEVFRFWYNDNNHIRTPFPSYIQQKLKIEATEKFYNWVNNLKKEAKDELNEEAIAEKFEEVLFSLASQMVQTEDERISILFPFLPRINDVLKDKDQAQNTVIDRHIKKEKDISFLHLMCVNKETDKKWETSIELPM